MTSELREFQDELKGRGWDIEKTNGGHYKYTHRQSGEFIFGASTPGDDRGILNERARARRIERKAGTLVIDQKRNKNMDEKSKTRLKSRLRNGQRVEYGTNPRDPYPNLPMLFTLEAFTVSESRVRVVLPGDFVAHSISITGNENWRELIISASEGEILRALKDDEAYAIMEAAPIKNLRQGAKSFWHARRIGNRIQVGTLLDFLSYDFRNLKKNDFCLDMPTKLPEPEPKTAFGSQLSDALQAKKPKPKQPKEQPMSKVVQSKPKNAFPHKGNQNNRFVQAVVDRLGYGGQKKVADMCGLKTAAPVSAWYNGRDPVPDYHIATLKQTSEGKAIILAPKKPEAPTALAVKVNDVVTTPNDETIMKAVRIVNRAIAKGVLTAAGTKEDGTLRFTMTRQVEL